MGRIRYLGSKVRLKNAIVETLGQPSINSRFVDLFSGTGVVSEVAASKGWSVFANDILHAATTLTTARLLSAEEVPFQNFGGYTKVVTELNNASLRKDFFLNEYSPVGINAANATRVYFSPENAMKIDGMRFAIKTWFENGLINFNEKQLLLADLIEATNQIANIAGTYGFYLKELGDSALRPILILERKLQSILRAWEVTNLDAFQVRVNPDDVVYADPPYTKRQYAAYYHILETIACEDEPVVSGKTGLRPWETKSSIFCYKLKAPGALQNLLTNLNCKRILLSYNSEGHIGVEELFSIVRQIGDVNIIRFEKFGRYDPNKKARGNVKTLDLTEYLIDINCT